MAEKRRHSGSELPTKNAKVEAICCLKSCSADLCEEDRAEVKTCLPSRAARSALPSDYVVDWSSSGEARFHSRCWVELLRNARVRNQKRATIRMLDEEKRLVKEAAKTAEFHDSSATLTENAKRIASLIRSASFCVAFTGAGISTSAGIGDYRGKSGKWTEQDREAAAESNDDDEEGVPYERLRPTYTHEALVKLAEMGLLKHVISQNGDGLHSLSGIPADKLSELHGNVFLEVCEQCSHKYYRPYYVLDDTAGQYFEELNENGKTSIPKPRHAVQCSRCELCHRTGRKCTQPGCRLKPLSLSPQLPLTHSSKESSLSSPETQASLLQSSTTPSALSTPNSTSIPITTTSAYFVTGRDIFLGLNASASHLTAIFVGPNKNTQTTFNPRVVRKGANDCVIQLPAISQPGVFTLLILNSKSTFSELFQLNMFDPSAVTLQPCSQTTFHVNQKLRWAIDCSNAGPGFVSCQINGDYVAAEQSPQESCHVISFTPYSVGSYTLEVMYNSYDTGNTVLFHVK